MAQNSDKMKAKLEKLDAVLREMGVCSGQAVIPPNVIVNIAAILKFHDEIETAMGEHVSDGDYFSLMASQVMQGGAIVLTDESTTGQVVEVEFSKKVRF